MALYYALGDALVSKEELWTNIGERNFQRFLNALISREGDAKYEFMFGKATAQNALRSFETDSGQVIDFEPIGISKPLTIQVRHIYTGNKAEGFWGTKDMLVASAMKSISTYDAAPRAVNFLVPKTKNNRNFRVVDAMDKGTPLICYSPSLPLSSSVVTLEVMFSSFPKETFDAVSQAFSVASGVPVFAPASGYLVAASIVTKLLGGIGKSLTDGTPSLKQTEEITFTTPGSQEGVAGFALLISNEVRRSVLQDYKVNRRGELVLISDETKLYDGEFPYAVISIDGRENDDFKTFAPTAASAAQLDKFYNINEGSSQPLGTLVDALKLFNDMKFREKAINMSEKLKGKDKNSEEYKKLLAQYNAYVDNIGTNELKPPPLP